MTTLATTILTDPWEQALSKHGQSVQPLCKHIYDCLELSEGVTAIGVVSEPPPDHSPFTYALKVILKKEKEFHEKEFPETVVAGRFVVCGRRAARQIGRAHV
jgi:hypothetical protein